MDPYRVNFTPTIHGDTYPYIDPTKLDLNGRYIAITGASRGVGKAMAISYAKAGASGIALLARSPLTSVRDEVLQAAESAHRRPPQVLAIKYDTLNQSDITTAVTTITREFANRLDILINNAGVLEAFQPVIDSDPDTWWNTFEVNLKGLYMTTRAFLPLLLANTNTNTTKTVVQISSVGAHAVLPGGSAYETSKHAVLRFNNFLNAEYGVGGGGSGAEGEGRGLIVYGIHPGAVMTELAQNMPRHMHGIFTDTPALCGDTVAWLTSERREWLTDRYLSATWDMAELEGKRKAIVDKDLLKVKLRVE